jgi:hypothetical protein
MQFLVASRHGDAKAMDFESQLALAALVAKAQQSVVLILVY